MEFEEWLKEKYKDKPDDFEFVRSIEYMEYFQYVVNEIHDKAWDKFIAT